MRNQRLNASQANTTSSNLTDLGWAAVRRLNPVLRGWCAYFHHGVCSRTFQYLDHYAFWRVVGWIRKRHHGLNWQTIRRRYLPAWEIRDGASVLYRPRAVEIIRYRYRGARIDTPWASTA